MKLYIHAQGYKMESKTDRSESEFHSTDISVSMEIMQPEVTNSSQLSRRNSSLTQLLEVATSQLKIVY
jgi:hypothetical protein